VGDELLEFLGEGGLVGVGPERAEEAVEVFGEEELRHGLMQARLEGGYFVLVGDYLR